MDISRKLIIVICGNRAEYDKFREWKRISKGDPWVRYVGRKQELIKLEGLKEDQAMVIYFGNYWLNPCVGDWRLERFECVKS